MKKGILASAAVTSVLAGAVLLAFASGVQAKDVGTFTCNNCGVSVPAPDPGTLNALNYQERIFNAPRPFNWNPQGMKPGDSITMCNGLVCTQYVFLGEAQYGSGKVASTILPPEAMGPWRDGTGGGGGSGSGSRGGSGSVTVGPISSPGGGGTVTVGPISGGGKKKPVQERAK